MSIELSTALLAGYEPIDQDHMALVTQVNDFCDLVKAGADKHAIYDAIDALSIAFGQHFEHEKEMMIQAHYQDTQHHLSEHTKLLGDLGHLLYRIDEATQDELLNVSSFVESWFLNHVAASDRPLGKFLKSRS